MWKFGIALLLLVPLPASGGGLTGVCKEDDVFALALHGGAVWGAAPHGPQEAAIERELHAARERLARGDWAIDVVEAAVAAMEDSGVFNAGRGSTANRAGEIEMDASIMDGRLLNAGAVASIRRLANPVMAARLVMERTPHVLMVGPAADAHLLGLGAAEATQDQFLHAGVSFPDLSIPEVGAPDAGQPPFGGIWTGVLAGRLNLALILGTEAQALLLFGADSSLGFEQPAALHMPVRHLNDYLIAETDSLRLSYRPVDGGLEARLTTAAGDMAEGLLRPNPDLLKKGGTVGAVARDRCGDLAAASSTGGFGLKLPGRVGDTPQIGAGIYADNRSAAIATTGHGEFFIRHAVAAQIADRIRFGHVTLAEAARNVIMEELWEAGGEGGAIAVDADGRIEMVFNTDGMVRGWTTDALPPQAMTSR